MSQQLIDAITEMREEDALHPELILAGEMLAQISEVVKPLLVGESTAQKVGRAIFGTVEGDTHDIAKAWPT